MQTKVLIIDDELEVLDWLNLLLSQNEKFTVFTASTVDKGLEIYYSNAIDLIITDALLPEKDGFDLVFELKKERIKTPIIMVTGDAGFNVIKPEAFGIAALLKKPFSEESLLKEIENALNIKL